MTVLVGCPECASWRLVKPAVCFRTERLRTSSARCCDSLCRSIPCPTTAIRGPNAGSSGPHCATDRCNRHTSNGGRNRADGARKNAPETAGLGPPGDLRRGRWGGGFHGRRVGGRDRSVRAHRQSPSQGSRLRRRFSVLVSKPWIPMLLSTSRPGSVSGSARSADCMVAICAAVKALCAMSGK